MRNGGRTRPPKPEGRSAGKSIQRVKERVVGQWQSAGYTIPGRDEGSGSHGHRDVGDLDEQDQQRLPAEPGARPRGVRPGHGGARILDTDVGPRSESPTRRATTRRAARARFQRDREAGHKVNPCSTALLFQGGYRWQSVASVAGVRFGTSTRSGDTFEPAAQAQSRLSQLSQLMIDA